MIEVTEQGAVATITIDHCGLLSLHHPEAGTALRDAVRDAADRDEIKAIVIRASGADFSPAASETDIAVAATARKDRIWSTWHEVYAAPTGLYQTVCFCRKIVITSVKGCCAGAGSMLVLCSDLTVAAPDARFESPFATLPEANLVLAALTMRLNRAKSWVLAQTPLSAEEAFDAGLVNRVVAADALDGEAARMARAAAKMPLDGISMSKINMETCLDAQGVGREFDMAGFYATTLEVSRNARGGASS